MVWVRSNEIFHVSKPLRQLWCGWKTPVAKEPEPTSIKGLNFEPLFLIAFWRSLKGTSHRMHNTTTLWALGHEVLPGMDLEAFST
jgi:hypothetical protein